jgi:hypothetical protein
LAARFGVSSSTKWVTRVRCPVDSMRPTLFSGDHACRIALQSFSMERGKAGSTMRGPETTGLLEEEIGRPAAEVGRRKEETGGGKGGGSISGRWAQCAEEATQWGEGEIHSAKAAERFPAVA